MFVYNITLNMDVLIEQEVLVWVEEYFIPEVMKDKYFYEFQLCKLHFVDQETPAYAIQFFSKLDMNQHKLLEEGQEKHIEPVIAKFGLQVMPFASVLDVIKPAYLSFINQN